MNVSINRLPVADMDKLSAFTHALHARIDRQNEDEQLYADLTGLYCDIIKEVSRNDATKVLCIFEYAKHLCYELFLYSGEKAYIMGLENRVALADSLVARY